MTYILTVKLTTTDQIEMPMKEFLQEQWEQTASAIEGDEIVLLSCQEIED